MIKSTILVPKFVKKMDEINGFWAANDNINEEIHYLSDQISQWK